MEDEIEKPSTHEEWLWNLPYSDAVDAFVFGEPKRLLIKGPMGPSNHFLTVRPPTADESPELLTQIEQETGEFAHLEQVFKLFEAPALWTTGLSLGDLAIWVSRQAHRKDAQPIGPNNTLYDRRVVQQAIQPMIEQRTPGIWVVVSEIVQGKGFCLRLQAGEVMSAVMCCLPDGPNPNPDHLLPTLAGAEAKP